MSATALFTIIYHHFVQGIYNYIPETSHVSRVYSVVVILQLQLMVHVKLFTTLSVLYLYISTCRSRRSVPNVVL